MEGVNMTAVIITAIVCVTVIILAKIGGSKNADSKAQKKSTRQQSE